MPARPPIAAARGRVTRVRATIAHASRSVVRGRPFLAARESRRAAREICRVRPVLFASVRPGEATNNREAINRSKAIVRREAINLGETIALVATNRPARPTNPVVTTGLDRASDRRAKTSRPTPTRSVRSTMICPRSTRAWKRMTPPKPLQARNQRARQAGLLAAVAVVVAVVRPVMHKAARSPRHRARPRHLQPARPNLTSA